MLKVKCGKKKNKNAYSQERNVNQAVRKLTLLWNVLQLTCNICEFTNNYNVYLRATLELIKRAPRRAQISLDLRCRQVGL